MGERLEDINKYIYNSDEYFNDKDFIGLLTTEIERHKLINSLDAGECFYRARRVNENDKSKMGKGTNGFWGYDSSNSGAPPNNVVSESGRFNAAYESMLYVANDKYTALAEMKSSKGEWMSIAEMKLVRSLRIINFADIHENGGQSILDWISFSTRLPNAIREYHFSQQLGKAIKNMGFDGIAFDSSISVKGINYVLFDPEVAVAINSRLFQTKSVLYYAEELLPRDLNSTDNGKSNYKLLPKSITSVYKESEIESFWIDYSERKGVNA